MIDEVSWSSFEPQSLVVLVKLAVCTRSSLEPQSFSASVAPRGPVLCPCFLVQGAGLQNALWGLWSCLTRAVDCVCDRLRQYRWICRQETADHALGFVGLSHTGSRLCVWQTEAVQVGVQAADCRPCSGVCGPVSHGQSTVCVTDWGSTDGHAGSSGQSVAGRQWSTGGATGVACGRQMEGFCSYQEMKGRLLGASQLLRSSKTWVVKRQLSVELSLWLTVHTCVHAPCSLIFHKELSWVRMYHVLTNISS